MPCTITIRENFTDRTAEIKWEDSWIDEDSATEYVWTDGNYGCDCNRELFLRRYFGEDVEVGETLCGNARYSITSVVENGVNVYSETEK